MEERGVLLTNFYGTTHPSLPNYLAQVGGSHFDVKDDEAHDIDAETVFDRLEDAGLDWLSVQENYPTDYTGCMTGSFYDEKLNPDGMGELGYYARKHNPPMSFISVSQNETRCQEHVISEIMFDRMLESGKPLPEMIYYTPNMLNDWYYIEHSPHALVTTLTTYLTVIHTCLDCWKSLTESTRLMKREPCLLVYLDVACNDSSCRLYSNLGRGQLADY